MGRRVLILLALSALVAVVIVALSSIIIFTGRLASPSAYPPPIATFDPNVTATITPTAPDTPTTFEQTPTIIPFKTQTPP
jgi:hypothetical protein